MRTLLAGGTICTFDSSHRCIPDGYLGINDGRIAFVSNEIPGNFNPDRTIDCHGDLILPGFVNCHTHLAENLFKGLMEEVNFEGLFYTTLFRWESLLDPEMVYWGSMAGALDALRCGVTTISDMYHHASATAEAVSEVGIRGHIGQKILGFALKRPPHQTESGIDYNFDFSAFSAQLDAAVEFASAWAGKADGRITTCIAPHATNTLNREMFATIADRAAAEGLRIHLHLAQMASERKAILSREGMGCVAFLEDVGLLDRPVLGAHAIFLDEGEIEILRRNNVSVAHNPVPNARDAAVVAPIDRMQNAGVTVGLGTDAFEMNLLNTARFAALISRVHTGQPDYLPAYDALAMATIEGAKALGLEQEIGSLEAGKCADIVVFDLSSLNTQPLDDPLKNLFYYGDVSNIKYTIVNGGIVYDGRNFSWTKESAVKEELKRVSIKLRSKIQQLKRGA